MTEQDFKDLLKLVAKISDNVYALTCQIEALKFRVDALEEVVGDPNHMDTI